MLRWRKAISVVAALWSFGCSGQVSPDHGGTDADASAAFDGASSAAREGGSGIDGNADSGAAPDGAGPVACEYPATIAPAVRRPQAVRCAPNALDAGPDECATDDDCPDGGVCDCSTPPYPVPAPGGKCLPANCHVDANCGPDAFCSPVLPQPCGVWFPPTGYYCRTDADCPDQCSFPDSLCTCGYLAGAWSVGCASLCN